MKRDLISRVSGSDRIQTAIEASKALYQAALNPATRNIGVVVANGYNYPDALAGALLAGISNGPLLLTKTDSLSAGVGAEIKRLGANRVYVVGGEPAVSNTVFAQLQALNPGIAVYRVAGDNRIQTAMEIALQGQADAPGYGKSISRLAIIAYAYNYPDALSAAPLAAARNVPILLTGTGSLAADTDEALTHLGTTDVVITGSQSVVSANVENQLKAKLGSTHALRVAGGDRYETPRSSPPGRAISKARAQEVTGLSARPQHPRSWTRCTRSNSASHPGKHTPTHYPGVWQQGSVTVLCSSPGRRRHTGTSWPSTMARCLRETPTG